MAKRPVDLRLVMTRASEYSAAASALSDRIEAFEIWLQSFQGKINTQVPFVVNNDEYSLCFDRCQGNWGLSVRKLGRDGDYSYVGPLTSQPIPIKVNAALAFPELLSQLMCDQSQGLEILNQAVDVVDSLLPKNGGQPK